MKNYLINLENTFREHADSSNAFHMKRYMKNQFEFFGIKSPLRKEISKPFLRKDNLPNITLLKDITTQLWLKPQREFQYFTMELLKKYLKQIDSDSIYHLEYLLITKVGGILLML